MIVTRLVIKREMDAEGKDHVWFKARDAEGNVPTLLEMLGLLELAKGCAEEAAGERVET